MNSSRLFLRFILSLILVSSVLDYNSFIRNIAYLLIILYPIVLILLKPGILTKDRLASSFIIYFLWCIILTLSHTVISGLFGFHLLGMIVPNMYILFWYIFSVDNQNKFNYELYLRDLNIFFVFIGTLGVVQFHFSKDLFGLITSGEAFLVKDLDFISFRVTSVTGSPQVYGLAMVLISILNLDRFLKTRHYISIIFATYFMICALYSQNKSVGFLFCVYLICAYILFRQQFKVVKYLVLGIAIGVILNLSYFFELFFRTTTLDSLILSERIGRLSIYDNLLEKTNPIIGQGWGRFDSVVTKIFGLDYSNPESFLLLLYGEGGIVVLFIFLTILFYSLKFTNRYYWPIIAIFIAQFFFVHAAISPFIFPFFFILFVRNLKYFDENKIVYITNNESLKLDERIN